MEHSEDKEGAPADGRGEQPVAVEGRGCERMEHAQHEPMDPSQTNDNVQHQNNSEGNGAQGETGFGGNQHAHGTDGQQFNPEELEKDRVKDAQVLEDAMRHLFTASGNTKLGATMMLVNLVATHSGITERVEDDMFATFKCLLPGENCLSASLYQAKTLTWRLGLDFRNINGCMNGCVLFDIEDTKDLDWCTTCSAPRYGDMFHETRALKVLRFFRVTPRLQCFYRIPVLSKLMRWQ